MAENTNVDTSNLPGADGNQPSVSQGQGSIAGAPQGSQELSELKKSYERLERELRGLQSRQDKGQNEVQRFMDEVKQNMSKGMTLDQAEQAVHDSRKAQEKDALLEKIARKLGLDESSPTPAAGNGATVTNATAEIIVKAGLDANSAEVIELIKAHGNNPVDFALGVGELKARQANKPAPSAAGAPSIQASPAPAKDKAEEIERGYLEEIAKVPRGRTHEVSMVKAKWRQKAREAGFNLNV